MRLDEWITRQVDAAENKITRRQAITILAVKAGVSYHTVAQVERGARMAVYEKARAVSEATDWEVNVIELCDRDPSVMLARIR